MATLIGVAEQDNVAVATRNLPRGAVVAVGGEELTTRDPIPFAHKVAIRAIEQNGRVFKYGVPIGARQGRDRAGAARARAQHQERLRQQRGDFFEDAAVDDAGTGAAS
jgi:SAF domain